jgi:peptide/nickel transport system ATP-binding protein
MAELQQEFGMAMMLITHNLGVVAQMAEEVIVMYLGKIVEWTDMKTLFESPKHPYTTELLKSIPRLRRERQVERLTAIAGSVPSPYVRPTGCPFHPRCPQAIPGLCDVTEPELTSVGDRHVVSCLLYSDKAVPETAGME